MNKFVGTIFVVAALAVASAAYAKDKSGDMACCAKTASGESCLNLTGLNLNADQKTKIEAWQSECMKAGCTKESRQAFLKKAQGILSPDQYAKLKAECSKSAKKQA